MKRKVISIVTTIILGSSSPAMAFGFFGAGAAELDRAFPSLWGSSPQKPAAPKPAKPQKPPTPPHYSELIKLIKQQLEQTKKIHKSVTENRKFGTEGLENTKTNHGSFFLKDPQSVYNKDTDSTIYTSLESILKEEEVSASIRELRDSIDKRIQHAAAVDKAVSLQTFQETENRFTKISELVKQINTTVDLKGIAELQAHIKGMLAMIQNEATKLQMVAHSRNAEQALISQQKQKRNMKILSSKNKEMPNIKFIR
ncbi:type IV secretion system protein [Bartonella sp. CB169]|uniref:type IV secretion system protein n=1 Tax=Bartonella sp. CB169 TaxID=3112257 RepID=UPI00300E5723